MKRAVLGELRFADVCSGLGGFHHGLKLLEAEQRGLAEFTCVLAAEIDPELRRLYVKNFPDLARAYLEFHPRSKWNRFQASLRAEIGDLSDSLDLYDRDGDLKQVHGDLRGLVDEATSKLRTWPDGTTIVPPLDLLFAGFPCQPFSKSGAQLGFYDGVDGTVFHLIAVILRERRPGFVLLENVGNFERHDGGNTWKRVQEVLSDLGYEYTATTHVGRDGGRGLLSPHHIGLPHHRERFFIAARHRSESRLPGFTIAGSPFPEPFRRVPAATASPKQLEIEMRSTARLTSILASSAGNCLAEDFRAARVLPERLKCAEHWQRLLTKIESHDKGITDASLCIQPMPSFPIWGFELDPWNHYPISENPQRYLKDTRLFNRWREHNNLRAIREARIKSHLPSGDRKILGKERLTREEVLRFVETMPSYASARDEWPLWKRRFIEQNRQWGIKLWKYLDRAWLRQWLDELYTMAPSHQKLEWNCQGEKLNLWNTILQFRPSGLRTKRFCNVPALVAMTTTQIPVVPRVVEEPESGSASSRKVRHLLASEALQLQGFPSGWKCPSSREETFHAIGNAVHAELVADILSRWFGSAVAAHENVIPFARKDPQLQAGASIQLPFPGLGRSGE